MIYQIRYFISLWSLVREQTDEARWLGSIHMKLISFSLLIEDLEVLLRIHLESKVF